MSYLPPEPPRRILCVQTARADLMKLAPILQALRRIAPSVELPLLHIGQGETDEAEILPVLDAPPADFQLPLDTRSDAQQTGEVLRRIEPLLDQTCPGAVLLIGDADATLACALAAARKNIAVFHVEAGLRSFDRAMPDEINRVLTDQLSELLFTSEASGMNNLLHEGLPASRIHFVGNAMIDTLMQQLPHATPMEEVLRRANLAGFVEPGAPYALLTLHRPSNVDDPLRLRSLMETTVRLSNHLPVIFPLHPRTRAMLSHFGLHGLLDSPRVACLPALDYLAMLGMMKSARLVLTDSGAIQEETTALAVPCLTLRDSTERTITVNEGSNAIAGRDPAVVLALCRDILQYGGKAGRTPQYWDGHAAGRIAAAVGAWLDGIRERR